MGSGKPPDGVEKAVDNFNKYRSPEAHAEFHSSEVDSFWIVFSGPFCRSCGFHDYFDDLRVFLKEAGVKTEIIEMKEGEDSSLVRFGYEKNPGKD